MAIQISKWRRLELMYFAGRRFVCCFDVGFVSLLARHDYFLIPVKHVSRCAFGNFLPLIQEDRMITQRPDGAWIVGDKENRGAVLLHFLDAPCATMLEDSVTNRECFVDDQYLRRDGNRGGEGEPHVHAARIHFHWLVDEIADLREVCDFRK